MPRGKVATYGLIAKVAGIPRNARQVGYALFACGDDVPWQRVINSKGEISPRDHPDAALRQRHLLEREGIAFDARGRVSLRRFLWKPGRKAAAPKRPF